MTANDSKPYIPYLNELVDECSNTYHHSIKKKPINGDYSVSTETIETNLEVPKIDDTVRINKFKNQNMLQALLLLI